MAFGEPSPAPRYRGFRDTVHHLGESTVNPVGNDYFDDIYYRNGVAEKFEGYCTTYFLAKPSDLSRRKIAFKQPLFIYLPLNAMHGPLTVDQLLNPFLAKGL